MESIQTKESANVLNSLAKAKANRGAVVTKPVATMVENKNIPIIATPPEGPTPATPPASTNQSQTRDYEKSWKELKTYHDTTVSELRNKEKILQAQLAQANAPQLALPKTKVEMEAYRKQYPEAMDVFQTLAIETVKANSQELRAELESIKTYQSEIKTREAFKKLLDIHPDAMEIRSSPQFLTWFNAQPPVIREILANSTDISAVAKQLTLYKLEVLGLDPKGKKIADDTAARDASMAIPVTSRTDFGTPKKIWTQTEVNAISADYKTWLKYRVELDDAHREGRVDKSK